MKNKTVEHINTLVRRYPSLAGCRVDVVQAVELICNSYRSDGKLLVCGNGGSAADGEHIVGELMKGFALPRALNEKTQRALHNACPNTAQYLSGNLQGALPAINLTSGIGITSAFANDVAPDLVFAQQVFGYGRPGDVLLAISTSGNSKNVCYAADVAKALGLGVVGLTGTTENQLGAQCDVCIKAPGDNAMQIQENHLPIYHALCLALEEEFFGV